MKLIVGCLIVLSYILVSCDKDSGVPKSDVIVEDDSIDSRLRQKSKQAFDFVQKNEYNADFCILIDMKIHSGKKRMFVWNFKTKSIEHKALCAHGAGKDDNKSTADTPQFSNTKGSLLTSLGKYKIGIRSYSQYGINVHYKLHGFETTNSNAFERIVVLHSYTLVPSFEIYPQHLPMGISLGCPVTDNTTMRLLDQKLSKTQKPVLLWIYY